MKNILKGIENYEWIFAKTMSDIPHSYTLMKNWSSKKDFKDFTKFIFKYGYKEKFYNTVYQYVNINGYKYWNGWLTVEENILINRAKLNYGGNYDKVAKTYDDNYTDPKFIEQDIYIHNNLKPKGRVLDVGCGTGLFLKYIHPSSYSKYVGIDPSQGMLDVLNSRYSNKNIKTINTIVRDFYDYEKYDCIYSLFGSPSYLTIRELEKLEHYLADGGEMLLMFLSEGYKTVYHEEINDKINIALNDSHGERWEHYIMITEKELPSLINKLKAK